MIATLFSRFTNSTSPGNLPPVALRHGGGAGVDALAIPPTYSQLLADRANAQHAYDTLCRRRQSQAAEAARKRLWAATCAVLDYERKAGVQ
jgi:hypothetical protein